MCCQFIDLLDSSVSSSELLHAYTLIEPIKMQFFFYEKLKVLGTPAYEVGEALEDQRVVARIVFVHEMRIQILS